MKLEARDFVTVRSLPRIVFVILGPEMVPDEDTWWSGYQIETGKLLVRAVGDDYVHVVDPAACDPLGDDDRFCPSCGATDCAWHGHLNVQRSPSS